jgi:hypothetical protein
MAVIDLIYDKVNEVIGGSDDNQIFTMMLPGTLLRQADFSEGAATDIELRCSNLVNDLLDVCQVAASHNGRTLPRQYRAALGNLLPKLNPDLEKMRRDLREGLKQTIEVTLPDGNKQSMTKLDWFYRLVEAYDKVVAAWADAQTQQQQAIDAKYPNDADAAKRTDAFNTWFAVQSPAAIEGIKQAHVQVTTVFSPDEEALIDSLLDSGDSEIAEAKQELEAARKSYPRGSAYPALFTPSDWPSLLVSDFGYIDMLKSPEAIALKTADAQKVIAEATANLDAIGADMPTDLKGDLDALNTAQDAYDKAQTNLLGTYTNNAATAAKIYLSKKNADKSKQTGEVNDLTKELDSGSKPGSDESGKKGGGTLSPEDVDKLVAGQTDLIQKQSAMQSSGLKMADAALKYIGDQAQYANLKPYYERLATAAREVADLQKQLDVAANTSSDMVKQIFPDTASERFSQIQIDFAGSDVDDSSSLSTSFSETSWSVDVFFGSASGTRSQSNSDFRHKVTTKDTKFSMGFLAAKVEVDRDWFDPGLFGRTAEMRALTGSRISAGPLKPDQFKQAAADTLPAFPTAFVIAKDVTISFNLAEGVTNQVRSVMDKHESEGGGILCFSVSHNSAEHSDSKSFSSHVQSTSVVIRIASPQIIGWYQEFVPADQSAPITGGDDGIGDFLSAYKTVQATAADQPPVARAA